MTRLPTFAEEVRRAVLSLYESRPTVRTVDGVDTRPEMVLLKKSAVKERVDRDSKKTDEVLTASLLSERTGKAFSSKAITGWWRGLVGEPGTKRFRAREGKVVRGALILPDDTGMLDKLFARFVPDAVTFVDRFPKSAVTQRTFEDTSGDAAQAAQAAFLEGGSYVGSGTSGTSVTERPGAVPTAPDSVPHVPLVPHERLCEAPPNRVSADSTPDLEPDPGDLFAGGKTKADRARERQETEGETLAQDLAQGFDNGRGRGAVSPPCIRCGSALHSSAAHCGAPPSPSSPPATPAAQPLVPTPPPPEDAATIAGMRSPWFSSRAQLVINFDPECPVEPTGEAPT